MKSYVFKVELEVEDDGRWSAALPALPGCAAWGHTADEAMEALQEMAQAYVEVLIEHGDPIPDQTAELVVDGAAVLVTGSRQPVTSSS